QLAEPEHALLGAELAVREAAGGRALVP
ncbi:MAG: hypothetical protein QOF12_1157, partial [Solirubrobacteraceae bacterium]|nr:hypothetical protein [Solirubrobacteraceae bacterium]